MTRKTVTASQFSMFREDVVLDRPSFLQSDENEQDEIVRVETQPVGTREETPEEIVQQESAPKEEETNELLKEDSERRLINKDFADGFQSPTETTGTTVIDSGSPAFGRALKTTLIGIEIMVILLLANWKSWVLESPLFTVKSVDVRGQFLSTREDILKLAEVETGVRLSDVDVEGVSARVMKYPMFEHVVVSRAYPSTIVITVYERKAAAFVSADQLYAVDRKGIVLPRLRPNQVYNLPVISGAGQSVIPGKPLPQDDVAGVLEFLEITRAVDPVMGNEISEIMIRKDSYLIQLNSLPVLLRVNPREKARSAVYLTAAYRMFRQKDLRGVQEIDCRYEGHVIAIEKKKA